MAGGAFYRPHERQGKEGGRAAFPANLGSNRQAPEVCEPKDCGTGKGKLPTSKKKIVRAYLVEKVVLTMGAILLPAHFATLQLAEWC